MTVAPAPAPERKDDDMRPWEVLILGIVTGFAFIFLAMPLFDPVKPRAAENVPGYVRFKFNETQRLSMEIANSDPVKALQKRVDDLDRRLLKLQVEDVKRLNDTLADLDRRLNDQLKQHGGNDEYVFTVPSASVSLGLGLIVNGLLMLAVSCFCDRRAKQ